MAVLPELQGAGIGGELLERLQADLGAALWCNARVKAVPFYQRHRWVPRGAPFEVAGVGPHLRMTSTPAA
jgi:GNAT superfamily N-acetyltransferase